MAKRMKALQNGGTTSSTIFTAIGLLPQRALMKIATAMAAAGIGQTRPNMGTMIDGAETALPAGSA